MPRIRRHGGLPSSGALATLLTIVNDLAKYLPSMTIANPATTVTGAGSSHLVAVAAGTRDTPNAKCIAIVQSNYIPWKGYFDLIAAVDEFVLYDDVQFTKNDWRNRNQIKTPHGVQWLSVPVGDRIDRRIRDVEIPKSHWQAKHWKTLESNYRRAAHFEEIASWLAPLYLEQQHSSLSAMNRSFIESICHYLHLPTRITDSTQYVLTEGRTQRVVDICTQSGATEYVSGPAAKSYVDEALFAASDIRLSWFDYAGYPEYEQQWGPFVHGVSIVDLLFNCGPDAKCYMKSGSRGVGDPSP